MQKETLSGANHKIPGEGPSGARGHGPAVSRLSLGQSLVSFTGRGSGGSFLPDKH